MAKDKNIGTAAWSVDGITIANEAAPDRAKYNHFPYLDVTANLDQILAAVNSGSPEITGTIREPFYTKDNSTFGVLKHIDYADGLFKDAKRGIDDLREELNPSNEDYLLGKAKVYIEGLYSAEGADHVELERFFSSFYQDGRFVRAALTEVVTPGDTVSGMNVLDDDGNTIPLKENSYTALFSTGKVIRNDIRLTQSLRMAISRYRKYQQKKLKRLQAQWGKVSARIPAEHKTLSMMNRNRVETLGDYQVVRQLVAEDWAKVAAEYDTRAEILNNHQGIYYVRVRETPVSLAPAAPLPLRFSSPDDLVPGCPMVDNDLPDELAPFMESVLDIAMSDWAALQPHYRLLPVRRRIRRWLTHRQLRLSSRMSDGYSGNSTIAALRLERLFVQNRAVVRDFSRRPLVESRSLIGYQQAASRLISLEDLLNGSPHRLRGRAEQLRNKLDQASHCLMTELRKVAPSIRLDWSTAAEEDSLNVASPTNWPGLEKAEEQDFNGVRTMIELVQWWFRQLSPEAASASHSAVRNLIRAALMLAAADDPQEILQGTLQTVPARFKKGDALRVSLNREALPGTVLQLVDNSNRFIATLRVDDFDDTGAVTTITQLQAVDITPSTSFTVTGFALPGSRRKG